MVMFFVLPLHFPRVFRLSDLKQCNNSRLFCAPFTRDFSTHHLPPRVRFPRTPKRDAKLTSHICENSEQIVKPNSSAPPHPRWTSPIGELMFCVLCACFSVLSCAPSLRRIGGNDRCCCHKFSTRSLQVGSTAFFCFPLSPKPFIQQHSFTLYLCFHGFSISSV